MKKIYVLCIICIVVFATAFSARVENIRKIDAKEAVIDSLCMHTDYYDTVGESDAYIALQACYRAVHTDVFNSLAVSDYNIVYNIIMKMVNDPKYTPDWYENKLIQCAIRNHSK